MKIALVHDYLVQYGGAERVLECFTEIWPYAPIYTLIYDEEKTHGIFKEINEFIPHFSRNFLIRVPITAFFRRSCRRPLNNSIFQNTILSFPIPQVTPKASSHRLKRFTSAIATRRCDMPGTTAKNTSRNSVFRVLSKKWFRFS